MPIGNAGVGGGRGLGVASGAIVIDTSAVNKAAVSVSKVGRDISKSMDSASKSAGSYQKSINDALRSGGLLEVSRQIKTATAETTKLTAAFKVVSAAGNQSGQRIGSAFRSAAAGIKNIRGELLAVGVAAGGLSAIGLQTAGGVQEARVQLKGMTGSLESAEELMTSLRKQAAAAGIPFSDMLSASRQLLPTLQGNTEELEKWLPIVRRVAVLNQREGVAGAAFSINEALSSGGTDLVSLAERFNISRVQLRQALEQTGGDFAAALDLALTKMGITQQTADEMGKTFNASFRAAKDAAMQALGAGFEPLLQVITPILQKTAEWLNKLREVSPQILTIGAGVASIAAVGAPALLFFGQLVSSAQSLLKVLGAIKASGVLSQLGGLKAAGGFGLSALAGVGLGIEGTRAIGRATGNEALSNASISDLWTQIRQILFTAVTGLSEIITRIGFLIVSGGEIFYNTAAQFAQGIASLLRQIGQALPEALGGKQLADTAAKLEESFKGLGNAPEELRQQLRDRQKDFLRDTLSFLGLEAPPGSQTAPGSPAASGAATEAGGFTEDQTAAITQFYDQMRAVEGNAREQRLQAEKQYHEQRSQLVSDYNRTAAREEADFNRQRTRQNMQFLRDVERIAKERVKRESEWLEELNKSIAKAIADSNSRIAEIRASGEERIAEMRSDTNQRILEQEEDYQRQREQRAADHRNRLLEAASRLDASAIASEQRNFATQEARSSQENAIRLQREREGLEERIRQEQAGIQKRIEQEKAGLEERLQAEREAHAERLAEAREADAERIAEMREAIREQQRIEDEDRAIRLQRTKEDHQRQLQSLKDANNERLAEINRQETKERQALDASFKQQLVQLGFANKAYMQAQEAHQQRALASFEQYWGDWQKVIDGQSAATTQSTLPTSPGSRLPTAGSPSRYIPPSGDALAAVRGLGNNNQAALLAASGGQRGGNRITTGDIPITVNAAPGMDENGIARAVRGELESLLRGMSG